MADVIELAVSSNPSTASQARSKVFVSYSRKDLTFAESLADALAGAGFDVFLDRTEIAPGEPWKERLAGLIAMSDTIVFVVSPESVASRICSWELEEGSRLGKRLLPIVAKRIVDSDAPPALERLNWIFCTEGDDRGAALSALDKALRTDLAWVREHTRLGEIAKHWDDQNRVKSATLRGAALDEAEQWLDRRPAEATAPTDLHQSFIRASRQVATSRQRYWAAGSLAVALMALGLAAFAEISRWDAQHQRNMAETAAVEAKRERDVAEAATRDAETQRKEAVLQKGQAERSLAAAKKTLEGLIFDIADGLKDVAGMRIETIRKILNTAQTTIERLAKTDSDDKDLMRLKAMMFSNFGHIYLSAGDPNGARLAVEQSLAIFRRLATQSPNDDWTQRDLAVSLQELGDVRLQLEDRTGALLNLQDSFAIQKKRAQHDPKDARAQLDVAQTLDKIGDVKRNSDRVGALEAYNQSLDIHHKLVSLYPRNVELKTNLAAVMLSSGDLKVLAGDGAGAFATYQQSVNIYKELVVIDPDNTAKLGALAGTYNKMGVAKEMTGDLEGALALYRQGIQIADKQAVLDPGNASAQRRLSVLLQCTANIEQRTEDSDEALADFQGALDIEKKLAAQEPSQIQVQRTLFDILGKIAELNIHSGDNAAALSAYQQKLVIAEKLAANYPNSASEQWDLVMSLTQNAQLAEDAAPLYRRALSIAEKLDRDGKLAPSGKTFISAVSKLLTPRTSP